MSYENTAELWILNMDLIRNFEAKFKDTHPVHYWLMKIVVICILMSLFFFMVTVLGIWADIEAIRLGGMILFGIVFGIGFTCFLSMFPVYIYTIWQKRSQQTKSS